MVLSSLRESKSEVGVGVQLIYETFSISQHNLIIAEKIGASRSSFVTN